MQLAVNAVALRGAGSAAVGQGLLRALARASGQQLVAWIPSQWGWSGEALGPHCDLRSCPPGVLGKLLVENLAIRRTLRRGDRLLSLGDTSLPRCPVPHLLMVQQLFLGYRLAELDFSLSPRLRAHFSLMTAYFSLTLPSVSAIVVQTQHMRDRLVARWGLSADRIRVVPTAIEIGVRREESLTPADPPYFCYVAGGGPHKNHIVLPEVLAALDDPTCRCKITVTRSAIPDVVRKARWLGVLDRIDFLGPIPVDQAHQLLERAIASVMPSKLESFGMPYYEAMALGCPVIAADRPFAREACAEAALYAPANDGQAFGAQVERVLRDTSLRQRQVARGWQRYEEQRRTWDDVARSFLSLLSEI